MREHEIEPQGILFDRDRWYLIGRSLDYDETRIWRADKVRTVTVSTMAFKPDRDFDVQRFTGRRWLKAGFERWFEEAPRAISRIRLTPAQAERLREDWLYRNARYEESPTAASSCRCPKAIRAASCRWCAGWAGSRAAVARAVAPPDGRRGGEIRRDLRAAMNRSPRLYIDQPLGEGAEVALSRAQAHYLATVMRLKPGDDLRLFNGRDGEWLAHLSAAGKRGGEARCAEKLAGPRLPPDIDYLFAPIKAARLDFIAQKATEMGARRLRPVITARTVVARIKIDRLKANAIEAAEQCNLVAVPEVLAVEPLGAVLDRWDAARRLVFCDEAGDGAPPLDTLAALTPAAGGARRPGRRLTPKNASAFSACPS